MADRIPLIIEGSSIREIPSDDRLDVRGALEVNGHVTPGADSSYDIGTLVQYTLVVLSYERMVTNYRFKIAQELFQV
jgi:hypothetical protein